MVTTGFSRIHVAKYSYQNEEQVAYTECRELARAKRMDISVETTDENHYYANNKLVEVEGAAFKSGTASIGVDGLSGEEEAFILGIEETKLSVGGEEVPVVKFGNKMNPPYLGLAGVKRMQMNGVVSYRPVILLKTKFAVPGDAAETQEENINWQDQDLTATIMRDDTTEENWKLIPKVNFDSEKKAVDFIRAFFGGMAEENVAS